MNWQPIETAPKDKVILLGLPVIGNIKEWDRRVYEGRWHEDQSTWTSVNGFLLHGAATHWQPLPPPPGQEQPDHSELVSALETIAAQSSGVPGSASRSDCMAAVASIALRNYADALEVKP